MLKLGRESWRQVLALVPALAMFAVPVDMHLRLILLWDVFAVVYLTLTWLAFRRRSAAGLLEQVRANHSTRIERLILGGPEQLAQAAAIAAFVVGGLALPQAEKLGSVPVVITAGVVAVLGSWFTVQLGFTMQYLWLYAETRGLDFPGGEEPVFADFTYFAFAIGTTFGSSDVAVTDRRFRRKVQVHGLVAFFFNTLILALTIAVLSGYAGEL